MSRISIEVSPEEHKAIKALALLEGVPVKALLLRPLEKTLRKHREATQQGYGAGHPDCPLCQQYAKSGRYNKKTEAGIEASLKEIKKGKLTSYPSAEAMFRDLGLR